MKRKVLSYKYISFTTKEKFFPCPQVHCTHDHSIQYICTVCRTSTMSYIFATGFLQLPFGEIGNIRNIPMRPRFLLFLFVLKHIRAFRLQIKIPTNSSAVCGGFFFGVIASQIDRQTTIFGNVFFSEIILIVFNLMEEFYYLDGVCVCRQFSRLNFISFFISYEFVNFLDRFVKVLLSFCFFFK